jgi:inosine-uridine nucleoside N-ribohydrolase
MKALATEILERLTLPEGRLRMVLDTDTYNEVDDQFALSFAALSPGRLDLRAVYAAPFFNDRSDSPADGMERSYAEILRLLELLHIEPEGFAFRGSPGFLKDRGTPIDSPAARDLITRAKAVPEGEFLYVAAIGAITNVASALLLDPEIRDRIVLIWLGGQPHTQFSAREFNLSGDIPAAQIVFDSGVPLIQVPCQGVSSHLLASAPDMDAWLKGVNPLCDMLADTFCSYRKDHFAWAKEIWDVAVIGYMLDPSWTRSVIVPTPRITSEGYYAVDPGRPPMREVTWLNRNAIFRDLFTKLRNA